METYTPEDIRGLIACKKKIVQPPKKELKLERGQYRNDMGLESEDGTHRFSVFMRRNAEFPENFSVGLRYLSKEGQSFTLFRCNGPHGHQVMLEADPGTHFCYHVHEAQAEGINEGNLAERYATEVDGYASYEQALVYFIGVAGIMNAEEHFAQHLFQPRLFSVEVD